MKAKITREEGYTCCPQGHSPVYFPCGTIVTGRVAEFALADRAAQRMLEPEKKITPPTEAKGKPRKRK